MEDLLLLILLQWKGNWLGVAEEGAAQLQRNRMTFDPGTFFIILV